MLPFHSEVLAVHAVLLPTGRVLFAAGSGNSAVRFADQNFGNTALRFWTSVVWDPTVSPPPGQDPNFFHPATVRDAHGRVLDFFCGGETPLPDGRVLSTGGTQGYAGGGAQFAGRADTLVFDPGTEQWSVARAMAHGRWYPSVITLGDGRTLAAAGLDEHATGTRNATLETFFAAADYWQTLAMPGGFGGLPLYAHRTCSPTGRCSTPAGTWTTAPAAPLRPGLPCPGPWGRSRALTRRGPRPVASVLLPPAQHQRVMILGWGARGRQRLADVDVVDFAAPTPTYQPVAAPAPRRANAPTPPCCPTARCWSPAASAKGEEAPLATNQAEFFDPAHPERGWTQLAERVGGADVSLGGAAAARRPGDHRQR